MLCVFVFLLYFKRWCSFLPQTKCLFSYTWAYLNGCAVAEGKWNTWHSSQDWGGNFDDDISFYTALRVCAKWFLDTGLCGCRCLLVRAHLIGSECHPKSFLKGCKDADSNNLKAFAEPLLFMREKLAVYNALVRLCLDYESCLWDPHTVANISELERVQRYATRLIRKRH